MIPMAVRSMGSFSVIRRMRVRIRRLETIQMPIQFPFKSIEAAAHTLDIPLAGATLPTDLLDPLLCVWTRVSTRVPKIPKIPWENHGATLHLPPPLA
jgi:hypothetical protein